MTKVLVVDDAKFMRITLSTMLKNKSYHIVGEAENSEEAIGLYKKIKPDIVTMDITMPIMNGIVPLKRLNNLIPRLKLLFVPRWDNKK